MLLEDIIQWFSRRFLSLHKTRYFFKDFEQIFENNVYHVEKVSGAQELAYVVTDLAETCRFPPGPAGRSTVNWSRVN